MSVHRFTGTLINDSQVDLKRVRPSVRAWSCESIVGYIYIMEAANDLSNATCEDTLQVHESVCNLTQCYSPVELAQRRREWRCGPAAR